MVIGHLSKILFAKYVIKRYVPTYDHAKAMEKIFHLGSITYFLLYSFRNGIELRMTCQTVGPNSANRTMLRRVSKDVNAQSIFVYLLSISGKNINTQLHIQAVLRPPFVFWIKLYFITAVSGKKVSKMMIFTPCFTKMEIDPLRRVPMLFLNE